MQDSLRLYHSILQRIDGFLPVGRITRCRNLALLMTGLLLARSVHLAQIVRSWPLPAKLMSLANRLRRFLSNERVGCWMLYKPVARHLLQRFEGTPTPLRLVLDTTQLGRRHRLLTVSLAYRQRAFPLTWQVVAKRKGHLSAEEQLAVMRRLVPLIEALEHPPGVLVLADSEFSSRPFLAFLEEHQWQFIVRLRGHYAVQPRKAAPACWRRLRDLPLEEGQTCWLGPVYLTRTHAYACHVVLHWSAGEETPWYLVSSQPVSRQTLKHYRLRMWTEELYGDLKGQGFHLEATRLARIERLERLVLGVFLLYVWLLSLGSQVVKNGWRHLVDRRDRRDRSYFRLGFDYLMRCLCLGTPPRVTYWPYL